MTSQIDATKPIQGTPTTESVRANFAAAKQEIEALQSPELVIVNAAGMLTASQANKRLIVRGTRALKLPVAEFANGLQYDIFADWDGTFSLGLDATRPANMYIQFPDGDYTNNAATLMNFRYGESVRLRGYLDISNYKIWQVLEMSQPRYFKNAVLPGDAVPYGQAEQLYQSRRASYSVALVAGTVTIADVLTAAADTVVIERQDFIGTPGQLIIVKNADTDITITSSQATDESNLIVNVFR